MAPELSFMSIEGPPQVSLTGIQLEKEITQLTYIPYIGCNRIVQPSHHVTPILCLPTINIVLV